MKTINEITREAGVSRQTLYTTVKKAGLSIDSLTTEKRGNTRYFDEEAEKKLVSLISKNCKDTVNVKRNFTVDNETAEKQRLDNERLQREAEELRKQLNALTQEREKQDQEIERLKKLTEVQAGTMAQNSLTIQKQAEVIQRYQERETEKLTSGSASESERNTSAGWIRRTWARISGKGKTEK